MTREEALAVVLKAIERECHFDACPTIAQAHELIRSEKETDLLGRPMDDATAARIRADQGREVKIVSGEGQPLVYWGSKHVADAQQPDHITFGDLLDECEAAAKMIRSASHLAAFVTNQWWHSYHHLRDRRERLMKPRGATTTDKGKGGDDRAS